MARVRTVRRDRRNGSVGACAYIGGVAANRPDQLVRWLVNPRALAPRSAMPALGLGEDGARDIAAYLETLG